MLTTASFIWGTGFAAQRLGMEHVGPLTFIAARFMLGGIVLLPIILANSFMPGLTPGQDKNRSHGSALRGGLCCGCVLFVCVVLQQVGVIYTTIGKAGFITALYIVIVPAFGLFLGIRSKLRTWMCVCAAAVGMYLLCAGESSSLNKGDVLVFGSAVFFAVHILVVGRFSRVADGVRLSCVQFFTCGALGFVTAIVFERPALSGIISAWASILYAGALSSGLAFTLQTLGQREINPVTASLLMSLESVFAALTGWIVLKETLSAREITGCILILSANLLIQTSNADEKTPGRNRQADAVR
jgi:drug/metabolite transporter (DMT)-like permease